MTDFTAQLGRADHPGLLTGEQRLERIEPGRNPYVTGASLAPDSPVFFGREQALAEALGVLRRPDKPGNVSVLGERRFGKSSFLNRIYGALAAEPGLVSIRATTQDWSDACPERFFHGLYQSILDALDGSTGDGSTGQESDRGEVRDYPGLRDFIRRLARKKDLRFVLLLDEFEHITGGQAFKADFFGNLRALGERPEYRFGYLIASRRPLKALCREQRIEESAFWNIFGTTSYMGLLEEPAARDLATEPLRRSLTDAQRPSDPDAFWTQEVAPLTGRHPALIQILLAQRWNAWHGGFRHNQDRIDQTLHDHLEDLWFNRHGKEEWRVLIQVVKGEPPTADPILQDLRLRGLVTADNRPFSPRFERLIPDLMPEGVSIEKAVERFRKGGEVASGLLEALKELARISGYLVGSL
ncbi:ATP-binding protein [Candidatus Thiosymbion oneisti]|uniref:ATP-binding protein n=1 Tax=Candidatus Thiosymbion oneisti TaxID=589554 RepID=UPI000B19E7BC|nr:ATP-binding protein [Candidatus Thiosymbion oneisti]